MTTSTRSGNYNLQGWIPVQQLARILLALDQNSITVRSASDIVRTLCDFAEDMLCKQVPQQDISSALSVLADHNISTQQYANDKRAHRRLALASQAESSAERMTIDEMARIVEQNIIAYKAGTYKLDPRLDISAQGPDEPTVL